MTRRVVRILYFAGARRATGLSEGEHCLLAPVTVAALLDALCASNPDLARMRRSLLVTVNQEWASAETLLQGGEEVGIMPPVSGG